MKNNLKDLLEEAFDALPEYVEEEKSDFSFDYDYYASKMELDPNNLDQAAIEHSSLVYAVNDAHALAVSIKDAAYDRLKQEDARLNLEIRQDFETKGTKFTEAVVTAALLSHKDHVRASQESLQAKYNSDRLAALKDAFGQRSYMLRTLTDLYVAGYYSTDVTKSSASVSPRVNAKEKEYERIKHAMKEKRIRKD